MTVMMIRAKVSSDHAAAVEDAVTSLFAAIDQAQPPGVRYTSYRHPDGATYTILLELQDQTTNPLPGIAAFRDFQDNLKGWLAEPAIPEQLTLVGEYRSF